MTSEPTSNAEHQRPSDPLIGAEVMRVSLEANGAYLHFETTTVMLYGPLEVQRAGYPDGTITPALKKGDVDLLWALVGKHVAAVRLGAIACIEFDEGTSLLLQPGAWRGEIVSTPVDGSVGWDEL